MTPSETTVAPEKGTPEYDQAMAAKFDQVQANATGEAPLADRPGWLPEKFKSPEDLAKAYSELEKKLGQPAPAEEGALPDEAAREAAADAGLDFDTLARKVMEEGGIDDADYEALEAKGIPAHMVDQYIDGQLALAKSYRSEVVGIAGGEDRYGEVVNWAASNLSADEIEAFNAVIDSGDIGQMKLAVAGLKARYEAVNGAEPRFVQATTSSQSAEVFRSTKELTAAMRDPRYKTDPAYRADVQAKLARSNVF